MTVKPDKAAIVISNDKDRVVIAMDGEIVALWRVKLRLKTPLHFGDRTEAEVFFVHDDGAVALEEYYNGQWVERKRRKKSDLTDRAAGA